MTAQGRWADGYVENLATGEDWNDTDRQSVRGHVSWTPAENVEGLLTVGRDRIRECPSLGECTWLGPTTGAEAIQAGGLPFIGHVFGVLDEIRSTCDATDRFRSSDNDPDDSTVDVWSAAATFTWEIGGVMLTSITGWREVQELNQPWGWATDTVGSAGYLEVLAFEDSKQEQWSQELRLSGDAMDQRLSWVFGGYWFDEDASMPQVVPIFRGVEPPSPAESPIFFAPAPPGFGAATFGELALTTQMLGSAETGFDADNDSWAAFFEFTYGLTEALSLTAGIRYTEDEREFVRTQTLLGGVPNPTLLCPGGEVPGPRERCEQSRSFDEVTPRVIASYQLTPDLMFYAGWSKGYSSGGFNSDIRMRAYEPEISKNWEVGAKSAWLDRRLIANVTAFHNTYENQQITVSRLVGGQPQADLINAQEATLYGVEGELTFKPTASWLLTASVGWMDGEYDEFLVQDTLLGPDFSEVIVTRDLSDTEAIRNSPYTVSISAAYTAHLARGHELNTRVGWFQRGRVYNTLETLRSSRQESYGLLDGRITWYLPNRNTRISLWGTNLLDETYFPSAIDLSRPGDTGTVTRFWAEPRRFGLEVSHQFRN